MWDVVRLLVAVTVGSVVGLWLRRGTAARKRRQYDAGEATAIRVRARGAPPFPGRWAWGHIDTGAEPLVFRRRLRAPAPLTGLRLVGRRLDAAASSVEPLVVLRLRGPEGIVEIGAEESAADLVERVLRGARPDAAPARRIPRWRLVAAALGAGWVLFWVYLALAGTLVDATVLSNDPDVGCRVEWTAGGRRETAEVDCFAQRPGDPLRIIALGPPFRGEAVEPIWTMVGVPIVATPFLLPIALYGVGRLRGRNAPVHAEPAIVAEELEVPPLGRHELRYSRVVETVRRRAAAEEWDLSRVPWWLRWFRSPRTRLVVASSLGVVLLPGFLLAGTALLAATPVSTALRYDQNRAYAVTGTVEAVDGLVPPVPWEVRVAFDGGTVSVTSLREPDEGDELTISYDPGSGTARLPERDGTARAAALAATIAAGAVALLLWRAVHLGWALRAFRRLRDAPPVPMRYAAVALPPPGGAVLLLFAPEGDPRPDVAVPLPYVPAGVDVDGPCEVLGRPADGEPLLVRAGGTLLYPTDVAAELDTATVRDIVNGTFPSDYDEDDDDDET